jgi:hypothetical protein
MKVIRKKAKPVSVLLTLLMLMLAMPSQSVFAAMIGTETVINTVKGEQARNDLNRILARQDVHDVLVSHGIDPVEAKARVDSLSDEEVMRLYDRIGNLPAGGSDFGIIIGAMVVIFIVVLITDILGYTNVFTFVKH